MNVAQGVLRPLTPMGIQAFRMVSAGVASHLGFPMADLRRGIPSMTEAAGRLFIDITSPLRSDVGRRVVQFVFSKMEARSGAHVEPLLDDARLPVTKTSRTRLLGLALRVLRRGRLPQAFARTFFTPEGAPARGQACRREALAFGGVPAGAAPLEKLEVVERIFADGVRTVLLGAVPLFAPGLISLTLSRLLLRGLATDEEVNATLRALPNNPTTEMDLELWHLSTRLRGDAASAEALTSILPGELARRYGAGALPPVLQRELAAFLERYGFRGVAEIDVGVARWAEDPTHILGSLSNYLAFPTDGRAPANDGAPLGKAELYPLPPDMQFRRGAEEAEARVLELVRRARAAGLLRGLLTGASLRRARLLAGLRELPKSYLVELLARARRLLLEIGDELVRAGRLEAADGVFFLTLLEVRSAIDGDSVQALVRDRRAAHAREMGRRHIPRILLSDGTEPVVASTDGDAQLTGTPASAGTVTGKARVILDPVGARIEPGEILVAPSTDPGWTPLFLTAGGLVMEMGGAMSHGAVVAREYGIPAVVGVTSATARIETGQQITVDGAAGTIRL